MNNRGDRKFRARRVLWGRIIQAFIHAGWNPPRPDDRIVRAIAEDMEVKSRQEHWWRSSPFHAHSGGQVLTARQHKIIVLYASGLTRNEIAEQLGIGEQTVKSHAATARRNLDAKTIAHAVAVAIRRGLIS